MLEFLAQYLRADVGALYVPSMATIPARSVAPLSYARPSLRLRARRLEKRARARRVRPPLRIAFSSWSICRSSYSRVSSAVGEHAPFQAVIAPARRGRPRQRRGRAGLLSCGAAPGSASSSSWSPSPSASPFDRRSTARRLEALLEETQRQSERAADTARGELRTTNEELEEQGQCACASRKRGSKVSRPSSSSRINAQLEEQQQSLLSPRKNDV